MTRTRFERRLTRTAAVWVGGTVVLLLVLAGLSLASGEDPRWVVGSTGGLLGFFGVLVARHRQEVVVGPQESVLVQRRLLTTRRVGLRTARSVGLRPNLGGHVQVIAQDRQGRSAFAPVLVLTQYAEVQQPAHVVEALLAGLEGSRAGGAAVLREELQQQLAHLRRGGSPATSPLAPLALDVTRGVGGIGAAGGAGSLFD